MQGDMLNQYCSGPQSVAAVILPGQSFTLFSTCRSTSMLPSNATTCLCVVTGMNLTGSIPVTFFTSMVDLQTLILDDNPVRRMPQALSHSCVVHVLSACCI